MIQSSLFRKMKFLVTFDVAWNTFCVSLPTLVVTFLAVIRIPPRLDGSGQPKLFWECQPVKREMPSLCAFVKIDRSHPCQT